MLIAEIHGKRFPEAEGQEDWLTSAVFGHLRFVPPSRFWSRFLNRARTIDHSSLLSKSRVFGIDVERYTEIQFQFWRSCGRYGEPDLMLYFSGGNQPPLLLIVEMKLNSGKSGCGDNDQLKKYLELLGDDSELGMYPSPPDLRCVVYLTRTFSKLEIAESVRLSMDAGKSDAAQRIFGMQWQDVLESASADAEQDRLLDEVAQFLRIRELDGFRGFHLVGITALSGAFYNSAYFTFWPACLRTERASMGTFYGN
jgi:hypothetical protein